MKRFLIIASISIFLIACVNRKNEKRYLPHQVDKEVYFGMPLADFKNLKGPKVEQHDDGMPFRKVFFEAINGTLIKYLGYYFDAEDDIPLYEVIIGYNDEATVNTEATKLLGEPNYKETEWKFELKKEHDILAWVFEKKLIITALIPKTEWYEDTNKE